jgi:hypothetical protein
MLTTNNISPPPKKKLHQPLKNSPNGEISPNLVTLLEKLAKDKH